MKPRFPGKRVLITGAGSGFGRALALGFARMGWKIAIAEINPASACETAELVTASGGKAIEIHCDVTQPETLEEAARYVKKQWDGLDILVNNAGVAAGGYFEDIPMDKWEWILAVNLKSVIYGCRSFIPLFKEQGSGYIINMASNAGIASLPEMGSYNMTKAGVISISETLRIELSPYNIGVSVVCPTFFKSNLMDRFTSPDERQREMADAFFSKTTYTPEKIADHVIRAINRNRFYIITQKDGKAAWYLKRMFPELYLKGAALMYRKEWFVRFLGLKPQGNRM